MGAPAADPPEGTHAADGDARAPVAGAAIVHMRCSHDSSIAVRTALDATVGELKGLPTRSSDVLIYKGRTLKDDRTLASYGVETHHTINLVHARGVASGAPSSTSANNAGVSGAPKSSSSGASVSLNLAYQGADGRDGNMVSGTFGLGIREVDQTQQQPPTRNPTMVREIMNLPAIQNLLNNSEFIRSSFLNLKCLRSLIVKPDRAHVLNDPNALRQTFEDARNQELMREMMRNTGTAMSNVESSPEGLNMLRRMSETVEEPLPNAATSVEDLDSVAALLGNHGAKQARTIHNPRSSSEVTSGHVADPLPDPRSINSTVNNTCLESSTNRHSDLGTGGFGALNPSNVPPPEELYATQLSQLQEMGFFDTQVNIRALILTAGNIPVAVERLLRNSAYSGQHSGAT